MTTPVRWKLLLAALVVIQITVHLAHAAKIESMSMTDDGWRPIVGSQRDGPYDEITHYRNPASKKSDPVKAEKPAVSPSKLEPAVKKVQGNPNTPKSASNNPVAKMPPHSKPVYLLPPIGMHSSQLPGMNPMHHHRPMKYSHLMKVHHHAKPPRGKPIRHQIPAFSTRDEVFVPAPSSNIGPYTFYSASQPQLKPRPPPHIEFANHFPIPNSEDELYQIVRAPVHQYVIPKAPISNDVHYTFQNPEEYNRNIAASPYKFESTKEKVQKVKDLPRQEALIQNIPKHPFHVSTPQPNNQVEVHVTKEKLKVFHNSIPSNYNPLDDFNYRPVKPTISHKRPATYEVTEGKWNQETPIFQYHYTMPSKTRGPTRVFTEESKPFLPTPVKPDNVPPTLPTDSEISTIYNQVKIHRQNSAPSRQEFNSPAPINFFDVKEVSTHFPILGPPEFQTISYATRFHVTDERDNEITTKQIIEQHFEQQEPETTTPFIATVRPQRNRRPSRRRRPTSTTTEVEESVQFDTATDAYDAQKTDTSFEVTTQKVRRPSRYRSTTTSTSTTTTTTTTTTPQPDIETTTPRIRQRRPRPTTTEAPELDQPENHKMENESLEEKFQRLTTTTERDFPANFESHFTAPYKSEASTETYERSTEEVPYILSKLYTNPPTRDEKPVEDEEEEDSASVEEISNEKEEEKILEDYRIQYHDSQKQAEVLYPEITLNTPENELDFTTKHSFYTTKAPREETTTETLTTTVPTTTTTTTTTTTEAPKRIRGRPVKYDNSNRPRFSVKEYKQRLSTTTTSTEASKMPNDVMRIRFPNRSRRPITPSPTTTQSSVDEENDAPKTKFHPKDPRHPNLDTVTEKLKFNTVNTRIRPFGRYKSTTEPTSTTVRVSIKPNIFGTLRRPTPISLKTRILNRQRNNSTTIKPDVTTLDNNLDEANETDQTEIVETTIPYSVEESADVAEFGSKKTEVTTTTILTTQPDEQEVKTDDFMQSQIVSDLTSSAKNEYNKPGLFKNVQPNSRKVPSYFTLATDDPILPIEAFFPNLKDKQ